MPVHIKGGTSDVLLYRATMLLTAAGNICTSNMSKHQEWSELCLICLISPAETHWENSQNSVSMYVKYYTNSNTAHCYNIVRIISSIPLYSVLLLKHSSGTTKGQSYPRTCLNMLKMQLLVKILNILGSSQTPIFI